MILPPAALGHLEFRHVVELWKRTQQLSRENRRTGAQLAGPRHAEERIGDRAAQRARVPAPVRIPGQVRGIDLIDLDAGVGESAVANIAPGRSDVADRQRHVASELTLDVNGVLMHFRSALVLIDEIDIAANAREDPECTAGRSDQARRERIVERHERD